MMILVIVMLATLSILLFAVNVVEASLSDLDNIKPTDPIEPEREPTPQDEEDLERESTNNNEFTEPETEPPTQDEVKSGAPNTRTYPTEDKYCQVNFLDGDSTRDGYILKFGTNNDDELYGTPNRDLLFGLDGNDRISGLGNDDIICGGKGDDYIQGESEAGNKVKIDQPGNDLIFGQDGEDNVYGGPGDDVLQGSNGDDHLVGDDGGDLIYENDGNDLMDGGSGIDDSCEDQQGKTFVNCESKWDGIIK